MWTLDKNKTKRQFFQIWSWNRTQDIPELTRATLEIEGGGGGSTTEPEGRGKSVTKAEARPMLESFCTAPLYSFPILKVHFHKNLLCAKYKRLGEMAKECTQLLYCIRKNVLHYKPTVQYSSRWTVCKRTQNHIFTYQLSGPLGCAFSRHCPY